jgi:hypothetical protein
MEQRNSIRTDAQLLAILDESGAWTLRGLEAKCWEWRPALGRPLKRPSAQAAIGALSPWQDARPATSLCLAVRSSG